MNWIKIEDELPVEGEKVLTYFDFVGVEIAFYQNVSEEIEVIDGKEYKGIWGQNMFYNKSGYLTDDVTHWMPLPKPPS